MCLIVFAWKLLPATPLLVAANRDEFYDRPLAGLWQDHPQIYAGRDLQSGGTWLGIQSPQADVPARKFAAITNVRALSENVTMHLHVAVWFLIICKMTCLRRTTSPNCAAKLITTMALTCSSVTRKT